jgi:hypothetical protein
MAWRRKKKPTDEKLKAPPPAAEAKAPPPDQGPTRLVLPDGTIEEISAATGRSIIVPGTPATKGIRIQADAPGWAVFRRRLRGC